jgi:chemotaxis protein methyltransferase CheR
MRLLQQTAPRNDSVLCLKIFSDRLQLINVKTGFCFSLMDGVLLLRDYIYETTGMYFPDSKRYYFENRINRRLNELELNSHKEYLHYLRSNLSNGAEFGKLIQEITINETSFYRVEAHFKALVNVIVPEIIKIKQNNALKLLRIWSAGCSSGEEPYSIALFILENLAHLLKDWKIKIVGTDIDPNVIKTAAQGKYSDYTLRNVPEKIRSKYFSPNHNGSVISDALKKNVQFEITNLNETQAMARMKNFDIIFCRNVLIYFNAQSKKRVLDHFYNSLLQHGYLFLGHSESLFGVTDKFKLIHFSGGMAYKKR